MYYVRVSAALVIVRRIAIVGIRSSSQPTVLTALAILNRGLQSMGVWLTIWLFIKEGCRVMNAIGKGNVPNLNFEWAPADIPLIELYKKLVAISSVSGSLVLHK